MLAIHTKKIVRCIECSLERITSYRNEWNIRNGYSLGLCRKCTCSRGGKAATKTGKTHKFKTGEANHTTPHTQETKEKIRRNTPTRTGPANNKWKGGISKLPGYRTFIQARRRARMVGGTFKIEEWEIIKKNHNYKCAHCGRDEKEIKLAIDHIIPISRGGRHEAINIQPLCQPCNSRKYNKYEIKNN